MISILRYEHNFTGCLAPMDKGQRLGSVRKRISGFDVGLDVTILVPGQQFPQVGRVFIRFALCKRSPEYAHDAEALHQRQIHRKLRNGARCEADDKQPALPGQG